MDGLGSDVMLKIKSAIKAKLVEMDAYVDEELPEYILVMVANKKTKLQMTEDLVLFLATNTQQFTDWLFGVLDKLQVVAESQKAITSATVSENSKKESRRSSASDHSGKESRTSDDKPRKDSSSDKNSKKEPPRRRSSHHDIDALDIVKSQLETPKSKIKIEVVTPPDSVTEDSAPAKVKAQDRDDGDEVLAIRAEPDVDDMLAAELMDEQPVTKISTLQRTVANPRRVQVASVKATAKVMAEPVLDKTDTRSSKPTESGPSRMINLRAESSFVKRADDTVELRRTVTQAPRELFTRKNRPNVSSTGSRVTLSSSGAPRVTVSSSGTRVILPSTIGGVVQNERAFIEEEESEYDPCNPAISSIVRVTPRKSSVPPSLQASHALVLRAVQEANKSIADKAKPKKVPVRVEPYIPTPQNNLEPEEPKVNIHLTTRNNKRTISQEWEDKGVIRTIGNNRYRDEINAVTDEVEKEVPVLDLESTELKDELDEEDLMKHQFRLLQPNLLANNQLLQIRRQITSNRVPDHQPPRQQLSERFKPIRLPSPEEPLIKQRLQPIRQAISIDQPMIQRQQPITVEQPVQPIRLQPLRPARQQQLLEQPQYVAEPLPLLNQSLRQRLGPAPQIQYGDQTIQHSLSDFQSGNRLQFEFGHDEMDYQQIHQFDYINPNKIQENIPTDGSQAPKFIVTLDGVDPSAFKSGSFKRSAAFLEEEDSCLNSQPVRGLTYQPAGTSFPSQIPQQNVLPLQTSGVGDNTIKSPPKELQPASQESQVKQDEKKVSEVKKQKLTERCKYWPACRSADTCPYHHPTTQCKAFPNCRYGDKCSYIHPNCKFDALCTRVDCPYTHATRRLGASTVQVPARALTAVPKSPPVCRFFPKCTNISCTFFHPLPCRYGSSCTRGDCKFSHPTVPEPSQMRWSTTTSTKTTISERKFAVETKLVHLPVPITTSTPNESGNKKKIQQL